MNKNNKKNISILILIVVATLFIFLIYLLTNNIRNYRERVLGDYMQLAQLEMDKKVFDLYKKILLKDSDEYKKALQHPIAIAGFKSDKDGMDWADCCIMVLPCGRSANTEAGFMKGEGKKVYVFTEIKQEPELMYKIYDGIITSYDDLKKI